MKTYRMFVTLVLFISLQDLDSVLDAQEPQVRVTVSSVADPTHAFPENRLYQGVIRNDGKSHVFVEAVQMPGEVAGHGKFFPCSIQTWDRHEARWRTALKDTLSNFPGKPHVVRIDIEPGAQLEVCRAILPHDAGRVGDKARFLLRLTWTDARPYVSSSPFIVGDDSGANTLGDDHHNNN